MIDAFAKLRRRSVKEDRKRVLLDTNLWRFIADANGFPAIVEAAHSAKVLVAVSPSTLNETLQIGDPQLRSKVAKLICYGGWLRLMPESYSESMEIISALRALESDLLLREPSGREFRLHVKDWSTRPGGYWSRVTKPSFSEHRRHLNLFVSEARQQARELKEQLVETNFPEHVPLGSWRARPLAPMAGWRGDDIASWRMDAFIQVREHLRKARDPYQDFLAPFVRPYPEAASRWANFWFYLVQPEKVPRQWLRWAVGHVQRFGSINDGTPGDNQLSTYLLDANLFLTGDKRLGPVLN